MDVRIEELIRENERLKAAIRDVESYARNAAFGGWRSDILAIIRNVVNRKRASHEHRETV